MEFLPISTAEFERYVLVLVRVGSVLVSMPVLGSSVIPPQVKAGMAAVISFAMFPLVPETALITEIPLYSLAAIGLGELMLGLSMGLLARLFVVAIDMGAEVIGFQMGYGIVTAVDPTTRAQSSILSMFQGIITVLIILATNAHHFFLQALAESFERIPMNGFRVNQTLWNLFLDASSQIFIIALKFAAPTMVVLMLTSVALGIVARTVPQMNIFIVGLSVQIMIGFTILFLSVPMLGVSYAQSMTRMGNLLANLVRAF